MKKVLLFALLILSSINFASYGITLIPAQDDNKEIIIEKQTSRKEPRVRGVSTPTVQANINNGYLTVAVGNFTGNVTVEIVGENGLTTSFYCDGATDRGYPCRSTYFRSNLHNKCDLGRKRALFRGIYLLNKTLLSTNA
ncbi:MAG: hypothetical protein QM751_04525 [Paludibacteraceae bacterium]